MPFSSATNLKSNHRQTKIPTRNKRFSRGTRWAKRLERLEVGSEAAGEPRGATPRRSPQRRLHGRPVEKWLVISMSDVYVKGLAHKFALEVIAISPLPGATRGLLMVLIPHKRALLEAFRFGSFCYCHASQSITNLSVEEGIWRLEAR